MSKTVAYQGTAGAFSEEAAIAVAPDGRPVGMTTFHGVFEAVTSAAADCGVVPVENAVAGSINQTYDLLLETDLHVVGETYLRIRHNLLAPAGTSLADIRKVISHPQALSQCDGFIAKHKLEAVPVYDTAGAAKKIAAGGEEGVAAIASKRAADVYGLDVLAEGIEDFDFNYTRFFVIAREELPRKKGPYKTSIVFGVRHKPGGLVSALESFSEINLTKLESRPRRDRAWSYVFYLDFEGHVEDPEPAEALVTLLRRAAFVKVLGSYPAAEPNGG